MIHEFNTDEDVHTVMKYAQQEARAVGFNPMAVTVDLDSHEAFRLEEICKIQALFYLSEACLL